MATTLGDMIDSIARRTVRLDADDRTNIADAIRSALRLYQGKTLWFLQKERVITVPNGASQVTLPSDYSSPIDFAYLLNGYYQSGDNFQSIPYDDLNDCYRDTIVSGLPAHYAIANGVLYLDVAVMQATTIRARYYSKDATLPVVDTDTSIWFETGQNVIRSAGLAIYKDEFLEYDDVTRDWARAQLYLDQIIEQNVTVEKGGG